MPVLQSNSSRKLKLPRSRILRGRGSFDRIFEHSKRIKGRTVDVRFLLVSGSGPEIKAGFVSGKKTGNAVRRNRNKRLMREAFRMNQQILSAIENRLQTALHIVFIAHRGVNRFADVQEDIRTHLNTITRHLSAELKQNG